MFGYRYDGSSVADWAGDSQLRAWRADLARFRAHGYNGWLSEGFWALTVYRAQRAADGSSARLVLLPVRIVLSLLKKLVQATTHINLPVTATIGPGLLLPHVGPIQVTPGSVIGADCAIHHTVTLAAARGVPVLGDHVMVGCHAVILGGIRVGDGATIGAGVTVPFDVPAGGVVVGHKPRLLAPSQGDPTG
jgi:serine O-acetyltransferase